MTIWGSYGDRQIGKTEENPGIRSHREKKRMKCVSCKYEFAPLFWQFSFDSTSYVFVIKINQYACTSATPEINF